MKDRCGTAQYFNNQCCDSHDPHKYLVVQITESVRASNNEDTKILL